MTRYFGVCRRSDEFCVTKTSNYSRLLARNSRGDDRLVRGCCTSCMRDNSSDSLCVARSSDGDNGDRWKNVYASGGVWRGRD